MMTEILISVVSFIILAFVYYRIIKGVANEVSNQTVTKLNKLLDDRAAERERIRKLKYGKKRMDGGSQ